MYMQALIVSKTQMQLNPHVEKYKIISHERLNLFKKNKYHKII